MHCKKGGQGDYDVCWDGIDFCSCECFSCLLAVEDARVKGLKEQLIQLRQSNPELIEFIKQEITQGRL